MTDDCLWCILEELHEHSLREEVDVWDDVAESWLFLYPDPTDLVLDREDAVLDVKLLPINKSNVIKMSIVKNNYCDKIYSTMYSKA